MNTQLTAMEQIDSGKLTRNQKSLIGLAIVGNISEFFDMFLIGFIVALLMKDPGWNLTGFHSGVVLAGAGLGTVLGSIFWGRLADFLGRKKAFIYCIIILAVFTVLCLVVPVNGWILLAILRVGVGFGVGGLSITSIPFVQEFVPSKQRGLLSGLTAVFIPAGIMLGSIATSTLGVSFGWRGLVVIGALPIFLVFWAMKVPESPRFHQTKGNNEAARNAYAWALNIAPEDVGPLPEIAPKSQKGFRVLFERHKKALAIVTIGSFSFILGSFTIQSWGQSILGTSFQFDVQQVSLMFIGVSIADLLGRLGAAWISDKIGRRKVMLIWGLLGAVGCLIAAFGAKMGAAQDSNLFSAGMLFFLGIVIAMAFGDGAFGVLNPFGAEQFSTEIRSTGLGLGYGLGATAKIVGPYFVGMLIGGGKPTAGVVFVPFIVFAILFAVGAIIYQFAKEAKGKQLEEI